MSFVSLEECELYGDAKYRTYVAAVDKALKNFEYSSEWPDLISALGKLNKVVLAYAKYKVIPRRLLISKRLAQCMHPSLPSGVHLKALETYDILFKCIGEERLAEELFIYSSGLFPLFGMAAMTVRPFLLSLYETHLVPLGANLQPALSGFLTGVLAGLDETSDYHQRTVAMLERVCAAVNPCAFYGSVWKCVDENALVRLAAINLILSRYDRKLSMEDQLHLLGPDLDLVVSAMSACFHDGTVLVQRSALDLLVAGFPLHEPPLGREDTMAVATAALSVVLRRDVSLNRRLFSWLLGTEVNAGSLSSDHPLARLLSTTSALEASTTVPTRSLPTDPSVSTSSLSTSASAAVAGESGGMNEAPAVVSPYFSAYGRSAVLAALTRWLSRAESSSSLEPFRIVASIVEKPEIGACVIDDVFLDVLRALYHRGRGDAGAGQPEAKESAGSGKNRRNRSDTAKEPTKDAVGRARRRAEQSGSKDLLGPRAWTQDFLKVANLVFGVLEPDYVWSQCRELFLDSIRSRLAARDVVVRKPSSQSVDGVVRAGSSGTESVVHAVGSGSNRISEICELVRFLLELLAFQSGPGTNVSVADLLVDLLASVVSTLASRHASLSAREVTDVLGTCESLLAQIQPTVHAGGDAGTSNGPYSLGGRTKNGSQDQVVLEKTRTDSVFSLYSEAEDADAGPEDDGPGRGDVGSRMDSIARDFIEFFASFVATNIFAGEEEINRLFNALSSNSNDEVGKLDRLERLLRSALDLEKTGDSAVRPAGGDVVNSAERCTDGDDFAGLVGSRKCVIGILVSSRPSFRNLHRLNVWCPAFKASCRLLVQFSSFPTYRTSSSSSSVAAANGRKMTATSGNSCRNCDASEPDAFAAEHRRPNGAAAAQAGVPGWLRALVCCAAFLQSAEFLMHATAVEAFVDLASLLITSIEVQKNSVPASDKGPASSSSSSLRGAEETISVVLHPLMRESEFRALLVDTLVTQVLAHLLWNHVDCAGSPQTVDSVSLLQRMYAVLPSRELVQNCLCETLADPDPAQRAVAAQRFAVYWHYTRELQKRTPSSALKNLERWAPASCCARRLLSMRTPSIRDSLRFIRRTVFPASSSTFSLGT